MATITKATRTFRNTKGSCYLTHGADSYDKRGLNKARRRMDAAVIAEQQEETAFDRQVESGITFRLVVETQVYENYGYRMKAKGGNEYHVQLGNAMDVIKLGSAGIAALADQVRAKVECEATEQLHSHSEWVINWEVVPSNEKTYEEQMDADFMEFGYDTPEVAAARAARRIITLD